MAEGGIAIGRRGCVLGWGASAVKSRPPGKAGGGSRLDGDLGGGSPVFLSLFPTVAGVDCSFLTVAQGVPLRKDVLFCVCGLSDIDWDRLGG